MLAEWDEKQFGMWHPKKVFFSSNFWRNFPNHIAPLAFVIPPDYNVALVIFLRLNDNNDETYELKNEILLPSFLCTRVLPRAIIWMKCW
jgi:hypothetical protein